ncbi:PREDICTED: tetraspanin-7 [Rhinopithecus bieti]|uniref:Tetraspanin-7 n=2 Tax=Rhinopithecus TaxID=542827 RepID=A0A2K6LXV0_RHIBE|nr:PREDICTED: tetraspanin-7 [Rhinopithecus bieti]
MRTGFEKQCNLALPAGFPAVGLLSHGCIQSLYGAAQKAVYLLLSLSPPWKADRTVGFRSRNELTFLPLLLVVYQLHTLLSLFQITGVILLAVGVWGKLTLGTYISLIAENSTNAPYVLIGTGTTIVVFGLFGCFATCRGSPWMLKLYAMFLSLVFLAELVAGISGFVFRHEIKDTFLRTYTDAMQNYNGNDERSRAVDHVQRSLSCCGVQNYTNWSTSPYFLDHGIPPSCCMNETDCNPQDLHNLTVAATKVNQKGCYDLVTSFMETNMGIIAGVAFGIAFSQLIGMLLACCLSRFITANQYEMV